MFSLKYSLEVFLPKLWPPVFRAFKLSESPTLPRSLQSIIFTRVYGLYSLRVAVPPPREMVVSPRGGEGTATRRLRPLY